MGTTVLAIILATGTPPGKPAAASATTVPATQPTELAWVLSRSMYPEGVVDEVGYVQSVRRQRECYASLALKSSNPAEVVEYELAAANLILARELETFASRRLLGLSRPQDEAAVRAALAAARERLDAAAEMLERPRDVGAAARTNGVAASERGPRSEPYDEEREHSRTLLEALQSFTTALEAVWSPDQGEEALRARRAGVAALAVLLEHERKDVASAALLWQAEVYRQMRLPDKAVELLPLATERIEREARRYQLFCRLLRCRLLADRGGYAAACALLLQIEERVLEWFGTDAARVEATNAAMLTRLQILEQWRESLDPATEAREIEWCVQAAQRIHNALTAKGNALRLLRLEETIPILMQLPELPDTVPPTSPGDE